MCCRCFVVAHGLAPFSYMMSNRAMGVDSVYTRKDTEEHGNTLGVWPPKKKV